MKRTIPIINNLKKKEEFYFYSAFGKQKFKKKPFEVPFLFLWNSILCFFWFFLSALFIFFEAITPAEDKKR